MGASRPEAKLNKASLRKEILAKREALDPNELAQRSATAFKLFTSAASQLLPARYDSVALYYPIKGEVDTRAFSQYFQSLGKRLLFPRTENKANPPILGFYPINDWTELKPGAFGICEPSPKPCQKSERPDVVLVPGLAFSNDCYRLGFGAGFYDRIIDQWTNEGARTQVRLIGLAYSFQLTSAFQHEPHDHPMDFVVTEDQIIQRSKTK